MTRPTAGVWTATKRRDGGQCIVCGTEHGLSFQHRQAVGQGGSKQKPTCVDGVTACVPHNEAFEHRLQTLALLRGWKVRRWVKDASSVPVWYPLLGGWHVLRGEGREWVSARAARVLMVDVYGDEYERWEMAA
jgi:hypothetical protein